MNIDIPVTKTFLVILGSALSLANGLLLFILSRGYKNIMKGQADIKDGARDGRKALHEKIDDNKVYTTKMLRNLGIIITKVKTSVAILETAHNINHPNQLKKKIV